MKYQVKYYQDAHTKEQGAHSVFIYIDDEWNFKGDKTAYCPIGQHSAINPNYLKDCKEVTKDEYIKASKGFFTPKAYL